MDPHTWPCKSRTTSTISSYVRIRDVVLKTYLGRWTIGRSGERGSGISVLPARYDDDDDDDDDLCESNRRKINYAFSRQGHCYHCSKKKKWVATAVEILKNATYKHLPVAEQNALSMVVTMRKILFWSWKFALIEGVILLLVFVTVRRNTKQTLKLISHLTSAKAHHLINVIAFLRPLTNEADLTKTLWNCRRILATLGVQTWWFFAVISYIYANHSSKPP